MPKNVPIVIHQFSYVHENFTVITQQEINVKCR
jgi:hypothetical protein